LISHLLFIKLTLDGSLERALQIFIACHRCSGAAVRVRTPKARQANHTGVHTPSGKCGGVRHQKRLTTAEEEVRQEKTGQDEFGATLMLFVISLQTSFLLWL